MSSQNVHQTRMYGIEQEHISDAVCVHSMQNKRAGKKYRANLTLFSWNCFGRCLYFMKKCYLCASWHTVATSFDCVLVCLFSPLSFTHPSLTAKYSRIEKENERDRVRSFIICTSISVITFVLTVKFALRQNAGRYHTKHTQATLRTWRADRKKMHFNVNLISIKVELKKTLPNEKLCHSNSNLQTILKRWLLQEKVLQPWTITIMKWTRW